MKIFITGGTGNIGQYVSLAVVEAGHEAIVLSRSPEKYPSLAKRVQLVQGHITDYDLMGEYVQGCDAVIHIALGWGDEPVSMLTNDTAATVHLLELAERAGVGKFIYTSSTAAMGHMRDGMDETLSNMPLDLYGSTKSASEAFVLGFCKYYNGGAVSMKRNVIRPGYTYANPPFPDGSSQSDTRFKDIARAVCTDGEIKVTKHDGTQFISSPEIARLYLALLESEKNEEVYLALGNVFTTWEEIARMALALRPDSRARLVVEDKGWDAQPKLYDVGKMERNFGLSFDSQADLADHVRWNVEMAGDSSTELQAE